MYLYFYLLSMNKILLFILQFMWFCVPLLFNKRMPVVKAVTLSLGFTCAICGVTWVIPGILPLIMNVFIADAGAHYRLYVFLADLIFEITSVLVFASYMFCQDGESPYTLYDTGWLMIWMTGTEAAIVTLILFTETMLLPDVWSEWYIPTALTCIGIDVYMIMTDKRSLPAEYDNRALSLILMAVALFMRQLLKYHGYYKDILIGCALLLIPFIYVYVADGRIMDKMYQRDDRYMRSALAVSETRLAFIRDCFEDMTDSKHDLLHCLRNIQIYMQKEDIEGARRYVQTVSKQFDCQEIRYSDNLYINAILNYYGSRIPGIKFYIEDTSGDDSFVKDSDIGILMLNILDESVRQGELVFKIRIGQIENIVFICFSEFETVMSEMNIESIQNVLNQYSGLMIADKNKSEFTLYCMNDPVQT